MKIVQFIDNTYAIRKFSIIHLSFVYLDLDSHMNNCWWPRWSDGFVDCKTESLVEIKRKLRDYKDVGTPIHGKGKGNG